MESLSSVLQLNRRERKPRSKGLTEIRGPYYSPLGARYLSDVLETMGAYVDGLKFAGGSFCLMPEERVRELIELCHAHDVLVSTGGFLERGFPLGAEAVDQCLKICRSLGFDTIEVSAGFVSVPPDDLLTLARRALDVGFETPLPFEEFVQPKLAKGTPLAYTDVYGTGGIRHAATSQGVHDQSQPGRAVAEGVPVQHR